MSSELSRAPAHLQRLLGLLDTIEGLLSLDTVELQPTLRQAANLLIPVLRADKVDVFLLEGESETLVAVGASDTPMGERQAQAGLDRHPVANGGRTVEVYQSGELFLSGHVDEDSEELLGVRQTLGIRSQIIVPVAIAGKRRGVVAANSAAAEHFSEDDLRFLGTISHWIGLVIHRAELTERVVERAHEHGRAEALEELVSLLTPREREVAALIALGISNVEIAERLTITPGTAANHVRHILSKFNVPSRARVAAIMAELGLQAAQSNGTDPE